MINKVLFSPDIAYYALSAGELGCFGAARGAPLLSPYTGNTSSLMTGLDVASGAFGIVASLVGFGIAWKNLGESKETDIEGRREARLLMLHATLNGLSNAIWILSALTPSSPLIRIGATLGFGLTASIGACAALNQLMKTPEDANAKQKLMKWILFLIPLSIIPCLMGSSIYSLGKLAIIPNILLIHFIVLSLGYSFIQNKRV
jgi:hypothetical protein